MTDKLLQFLEKKVYNTKYDVVRMDVYRYIDDYIESYQLALIFEEGVDLFDSMALKDELIFNIDTFVENTTDLYKLRQELISTNIFENMSILPYGHFFDETDDISGLVMWKHLEYITYLIDDGYCNIQPPNPCDGFPYGVFRLVTFA